MTTDSEIGCARPPRADAVRNRERILGAARQAFADPDADVSMAEIARRAGVGSATLYRNFADRRTLLQALYADEIAAVCRAAQAGDGDSPGAALRAWLWRFSEFSMSKRPVARVLLDQAGADRRVLDSGRARVIAAGTPLMDAAQRSGEVRDDLTLEQILEMIVAIGSIAGDASHREPILRAALDGLARQR